ncbi:uncharacterized protein A4U43_C10F15380 [Asparagus officinalis]|uniref:Uncharacterized protein n=1 Tax=Asparagus officinalis TaxID=4686 RepID=A0A5P1E678_ASPOF|nr:uncharacterized protein A4U43_C10F15380 [Asparagus officinalis]
MEIGFLGGYWIYKDPIDAFAPGICGGVVGAEGAERGRVFREGPLADGAGSVADAFARVHRHDGAEWERPLVFLVSGSGFGSEPGSAGLHFGFGGSRDGGQVKKGFWLLFWCRSKCPCPCSTRACEERVVYLI